MKLVLVVGTATEIGKTWVGARTIEALRAQGLRVSARKPAQSWEADADELTDAEVLAGASGEEPTEVCPPHRSYPVAMAPPMAADVLGMPAPTLAELVAELDWPDGADIGWLETVGGPRSPIAADGDAVDLAALVRPDVVVLVADAGLGTVNAVRLSAAALRPDVLILNRYRPHDDLHVRNRVWLERMEGLEIVTDPEALAAAISSR